MNALLEVLEADFARLETAPWLRHALASLLRVPGEVLQGLVRFCLSGLKFLKDPGFEFFGFEALGFKV